ncbi:hypothetical protein DID76_03295 [Candidatus Marinamargulisbacteria bacterium SCGC AG-414-C22]|nr:hypothetical protein DID76_03295 [Candidatus Marinamargulisbacteria bacterium SCGC AG-414-C22]
MKVKKNNDRLSFMIFSRGKETSFSFDISYTRLKVIIFSVFVGICSLVIGIYLSYNTNLNEAAYKQLKNEHKIQEKEIIDINNQMLIIKSELNKLVEREEELDLLLGDARPKKKRRKKKNKKLIQFKKDFKYISQSKNIPLTDIKNKLSEMTQYIAMMNETYEVFLERLHQYKLRFASTPSMRPLYGRIMSGFGMRRHPVIARRRQHNGIDIASWTGAPIQVTADGIVEYAGWNTTLGYVVVVDHGYQYKSLYAHCSQLLVEKNDLVQKGQVIAQVGSTGLSTGPHLHYEVKKWKRVKRKNSYRNVYKPVNPKAYLDIDMFTALERVW